jgi:predicted ATPase
MTEPRAQAALLILNGLLPITYRISPTLTLLMVFQMVALSARNGNAAPSPHAYASLGAALCAVANDYQTSTRLGPSHSAAGTVSYRGLPVRTPAQSFCGIGQNR